MRTRGKLDAPAFGRPESPKGRAAGPSLALVLAISAQAHAQTLSPHQQLAVQIYKELVEINTVSETGDTARTADAMAARLRAAGFSGSEVQVFKPAPRKGNLLARLRGSGARKPILLLAHLDVVPANPEDWSLDPFRIHREGRLLLRTRHQRRQGDGRKPGGESHPL
jgi:hypothetical protein